MATDRNAKAEQRNKDKEAELVITPGGPRPRHLVHKVDSGEMVTHDKQGNPRVVPRKKLTLTNSIEEPHHDT